MTRSCISAKRRLRAQLRTLVELRRVLELARINAQVCFKNTRRRLQDLKNLTNPFIHHFSAHIN